MAYPAYLGLDFGTSGARACAIAGPGEVEDLVKLDFGQLADHEFTPAWRDALFELFGSLSAGVRKRLAGIAVDATSATIVACDDALRPTAPALLYNDSRARAEAGEIARVAGAEHPAATATSGLAKILWLTRHTAPDRIRMFLHQADWLTGLLTERPGVSDYHNALKTGFDVVAGHWPDWLAGLIDRQALPSVLAPGTRISTLAGNRARALAIPPDCVVRAGTTDSIAAFIATGAGAPGDAVTSLGSTLVLKLVSTRRVDDARLGVYSHWFGRHWLAGGASNAGGRVLRAHFTDVQLAHLSQSIDPERDSGLDYYPLLQPGERFPVNDPDLPPRLEPRPADPAAFLHGILDGLAGIEAQGYRRLVERGAEAPARVVSTGGGAGNPIYTRIRARHLGLPVAPARYQEAAYGSALLAQQGTALFLRSEP